MTVQQFEDYRSHGLPLRSCDKMHQPHPAHPIDHPDVGAAQCWGRNRLPKDAEEKYCTKGCTCEHCVDIRKGIWPRIIMCTQRWEQLSWKDREIIHDSIEG